MKGYKASNDGVVGFLSNSPTSYYKQTSSLPLMFSCMSFKPLHPSKTKGKHFYISNINKTSNLLAL